MVSRTKLGFLHMVGDKNEGVMRFGNIHYSPSVLTAENLELKDVAPQMRAIFGSTVLFDMGLHKSKISVDKLRV